MISILSNLKAYWPFLPLVLIILFLITIFSFGQQSSIASLMLLIILFLFTIILYRWQHLLSSPIRIFAFSVFASLFLIIIGEGILLLTDPMLFLPENGIRDGYQYTWGHKIVVNSLGFRDKEFIFPKPPNTFRVMVLGDSITWGVGVSTSDRYTGLVQAMLAQNPTSKNVEILNFSEGGGNTIKQLHVLQENIDQVDPDLIVVGFNENDPETERPQVRNARKSIQESFKPWERISQRVFLIQTFSSVRRATNKLLDYVGYLPPLSNPPQVYLKDSSDWQQFTTALSDIKKISDERDLPPPIFMPLYISVYTDRPTNFLQPDPLLREIFSHFDQALAYARSLGFNTIDYRDKLTGNLSNKILVINKFDRHPNLLLHQVYAKELYQTILSYLE